MVMVVLRDVVSRLEKCEAITGPSRRVWNSGTGHGSPLLGNPFPSHRAVCCSSGICPDCNPLSPGRSWSVQCQAMKSGIHYMAENVGQKEGRLPERSADFGPRGGNGGHLWTTGTPERCHAGQTLCARASPKRASQSQNDFANEPHRRVGGFRKFGGQEFEMHEEGQLVTSGGFALATSGSSESEADA